MDFSIFHPCYYHAPIGGRRNDHGNREFITQSLIAQIEAFLDAQKFSDSVQSHYDLYVLYSEENQLEKALRNIELAVEGEPSSYLYRKAYAKGLLQIGLFEECQEQILWCKSRNTDDPSLVELYQKLRKRQLAMSDNSKLL